MPSHDASSARSPGHGAGQAARISLFLGSLVFTLVLLELALALVGYQYVPVDIQVGQVSDARAFHVFEDRNFEYDPELIWRPRRSQSVFNSQGFRGPELHGRKAPGSLRIFAVGDSNTLGWAGPDGASWPRDLHDLVGHVRDQAVVVNAGVWGYASYQGVLRFRQTLEFEPDLVLISFGANDAHRVLQSDRDYAGRPLREKATGRTLARFRLGQLVLAAGDALSSTKALETRPRVSLDEYRANLTAIISEARGRGIDVVLLTRPYVGSVENPHWWKNWGHDYNAATVEVAEQQNVAVVDLYSFFKGKDEFFADESHFTDEGHKRAAAIVFDHIRPLILHAPRGGP